MDEENFELLVKTQLIKKSLTISKIAQEMGISVAYLSDIIRGNRKSLSRKQELCKILELNI